MYGISTIVDHLRGASRGLRTWHSSDIKIIDTVIMV